MSKKSNQPLGLKESQEQLRDLVKKVKGNDSTSWTLYISGIVILILGWFFSDPDGEGFQRSGSLLVAITLPAIAVSTWAHSMVIDQADIFNSISARTAKIRLLDTGIAIGVVAFFGTVVWGFGDIFYKVIMKLL